MFVSAGTYIVLQRTVSRCNKLGNVIPLRKENSVLLKQNETSQQRRNIFLPKLLFKNNEINNNDVQSVTNTARLFFERLTNESLSCMM